MGASVCCTSCDSHIRSKSEKWVLTIFLSSSLTICQSYETLEEAWGGMKPLIPLKEVILPEAMHSDPMNTTRMPEHQKEIKTPSLSRDNPDLVVKPNTERPLICGHVAKVDIVMCEKGPHYAKMICSQCNKFIRWVSERDCTH